jgi:hypothetical protein
MTATPNRDSKQWAEMLDRLTDDHKGQSITIEVLDPTYGDNPEAERIPFNYANYDYKDDVIVVAVGGDSPRYPVVLRHMIWNPQELLVDEKAFRAVDKDGTTTIVSFFTADSG